MKRDLASLARTELDAVVVGGGIYGASIAREGALRGLTVGLVEKGDFGHATSWNSMKIVHGGLRYLQHLDFARTRESMREQDAWLRIAPGLVRPRPFVMPTYAGSMRGRAAMRLGLFLNDLLRFGPAPGVGPGRILGPRECLDLAPHVATEGLTGGALWTEAVIENTERLLLAVVRSAVEAGARVANYVEATALLGDVASPGGVRARDVLTGETFAVRARVVVDARGPWSKAPLGDSAPAADSLRWARGLNLVTRPLNPASAIGVSRRRGRGRLWFVVPWRDASLVGTAYFPASGDPEAAAFRDEEIEGVVREVAEALPGARFRPDDVRLVHGGFVPVRGWRADGEAVLAHRPVIEERGGVVRVVGVKYTTARRVAEKVVDRLLARAGLALSPSTSATEPLFGAAGDARGADDAAVPETTRRRLADEHGAAAPRILATARDDRSAREPLGAGGDVIGAELVHAVRDEMAQTLADVVFRRTPLASAGDPGEEALARAAEIVAGELGWGGARESDELAAVRSLLELRRARPGGSGARRAVSP